MVHNGVLNNYISTVIRQRLRLISDCDSEAILRVVEAAKNPDEGLREALQSLRGSMAIVLYDAKNDLIYLVRNDERPLWLLKLKDDRRWFFASERDILLGSLTSVLGQDAQSQIDLLIPLASHYIHTLTSDGPLMGASDEIERAYGRWY